MDWIVFLIKIILYIGPLYLANSSAMLFGGKTPLDLDRKFIDGKPIFGKGKTFRGAFIGILIGGMAAVAIYLLFPFYTGKITSDYLLLGFLLAVGAIIGDIAGSFFKRRSDIQQGTEVLFLDQLDFVVGGMVLGSFVYVPSFYEVLIICITTLIIHKLTNYIAFKVKLKKVPW